jgi:transformer-2 protein
MEYENESREFEGEGTFTATLAFRPKGDRVHQQTDEPRFDRDDRSRSRSPRGDRDRDRRDLDDSRARSASPDARDNRYVLHFSARPCLYTDTRGSGPPPRSHTHLNVPDDEEEEEGARNPGSNLFVTGIHPSLTEDEITRLFEKYGQVEQCNIMRDPHTKESRGFGFVKMATGEQADAAKEGLQGEVHQGRTLSIEKARRARPRTPTPGKYYGPPKRGKFLLCVSHKAISLTSSLVFRGRGGGRFGDRMDDRYDDRRGGYGRRDDYGGGGYGRRDDYERRGGGGGGYYDRPPPPASGGQGGYDGPRTEPYGGSRSYEDRGDGYH